MTQDNDPEQFYEECMEYSPGHKLDLETIYAAYVEWCGNAELVGVPVFFSQLENAAREELGLDKKERPIKSLENVAYIANHRLIEEIDVDGDTEEIKQWDGEME